MIAFLHPSVKGQRRVFAVGRTRRMDPNNPPSWLVAERQDRDLALAMLAGDLLGRDIYADAANEVERWTAKAAEFQLKDYPRTAGACAMIAATYRALLLEDVK